MLRIKNWSSFQSYKDRNPPWIRLHKKLLDDYSFQKMSAESRALLPMLWLIAAEDEDPVSGLLRIRYEEIAFRLRMDEKLFFSCVKEIIRAGFIEEESDGEMPLFDAKSDSYESVTKELRNCHSETETETETDVKYKKAAVEKNISLDELSIDHISEWLNGQRACGKYHNIDEHRLLEMFKDYCRSAGKDKGKKAYKDFVAAFRNSFQWGSAPTKGKKENGNGKKSANEQQADSSLERVLADYS